VSEPTDLACRSRKRIESSAIQFERQTFGCRGSKKKKRYRLARVIESCKNRGKASRVIDAPSRGMYFVRTEPSRTEDECERATASGGMIMMIAVTGGETSNSGGRNQ
jgi:hypothetical protein